MNDNYASEKQALNKTTNRVMLIPLILFIFLVTIFARIALRPGAGNELLSILPTGDAAYKIGKDFIRPALRAGDYKFADDYQLSKVTDSIYVVTSSYQFTNNNQASTTNFTIRLRYDGGDKEDVKSWSELMFAEQ